MAITYGELLEDAESLVRRAQVETAPCNWELLFQIAMAVSEELGNAVLAYDKAVNPGADPEGFIPDELVLPDEVLRGVSFRVRVLMGEIETGKAVGELLLSEASFMGSDYFEKVIEMLEFAKSEAQFQEDLRTEVLVEMSSSDPLFEVVSILANGEGSLCERALAMLRDERWSRAEDLWDIINPAVRKFLDGFRELLLSVRTA